MTANAMASDRDACLAAGMNDHIGKPFDMAKLVSLLIRMTGFQAPLVGSEPQSGAAEVPAVPEISGLDLQTALNRMAGMRPLYVRTARDFVKIMDTIVPELQQCLASGDKQKALMRLHTLKGNAGTLGATALAAKAAKLEKLCATGAGMKECEEGLNKFSSLIASARQLLTEAIAALEPGPADAKRVPEATANQSISGAGLDALRRIGALAQASDMEALQEFAQARAGLAGLPAESLDALDAALQVLELDAAAVLCQELLSRFDR
jgi:HPt (histidine-containing phosphotransfer) domain-containing protein